MFHNRITFLAIVIHKIQGKVSLRNGRPVEFFDVFDSVVRLNQSHSFYKVILEATVLILKREFQDQKEKINIYFEHLKEYDSQDGLIGDKIVINTTQKSSAILILYNIIESIVSRLLGKIHDKIMNETILYHS